MKAQDADSAAGIINSFGSIAAPRAAAASIGISNVEPETGQFDDLRERMREFNREMAVDGAYPLEMYQEMQGHIADFRNGNGE